MITHDFTGTSSKSYEDAIILGIYSASEFLGDMQDAHVLIKDLKEDGPKHYIALLEITKDALGPTYTQDEFEDVSDKAGTADENFKVFRRKGFVNMKALILDHFAKRGQIAPSGIPDFILTPLNAIDIENNAIEKAFMFAAEAMPVPIEADMVSSVPDPLASSLPAAADLADFEKKPAVQPVEQPV